VLGTPGKIGYMSDTLKHLLDGIYYPTLEAKQGMPYGLYVHGGDDATGAVRSVEKVAARCAGSGSRRPSRSLALSTAPPSRPAASSAARWPRTLWADPRNTVVQCLQDASSSRLLRDDKHQDRWPC
jgi:hypothetical protein